ncbi:ribosomal protein S23, partial [Coemansia sp. RSA 1694]
VRVIPEVLTPLASCALTAVSSAGLTRSTRSARLAPPSSRRRSVAPRTPRASFLRRSVLRPSSPTLPFASVSVASSSRTARRSPPLCPMTVASTLSTRTTRSSSLALAARAAPSVIFPESASRLSRSLAFPSLPCTRRRRRSPVR